MRLTLTLTLCDGQRARTARPEERGAAASSPLEITPTRIIAGQEAGSLCISAKARQHLPSFIQLIQNDESDYNFFTRLLAAWGLAFVWTMPDAEDGAEQRERLCLFDAVEADREPFAAKAEGESAKEDATLAVMEPVSSQASLWKAHYGVGDLREGEFALQNYRDIEGGAANAPTDEVRFSVHDESWDQLTAAPEAQRILATARAARAVSRCCRGQYRYPNGSETFQALSPGRKVAWREGSRLQGNLAPEYAIIRHSVAATDQNWVVTIDAVPAGVDTAIGVLPRPVRVADRPDLSDSPLAEAEAWPEPRLRCFLAVVEDTSCYGEDDTRNLCKVREIAAWNTAQEGTSVPKFEQREKGCSNHAGCRARRGQN